MKTAQKGMDLIKSFEALYLRAYDDFNPKVIISPTYKIQGTLTIGYGHTGVDVKRDSIISEIQANELLIKDLVPAENTVNHLIKVPLNQNQFDALVSFAFNSGGYYHSKSLNKAVPFELWGLINSGKTVDEIGVKWVKTAVTSKGIVMRGLIRRRTAEFELFQS